MITPSPRTLRPLLARYADARSMLETRPGDAAARVEEDLRYTLCVITGTSRVEDALAAADRILRRNAAAVPASISTPAATSAATSAVASVSASAPVSTSAASASASVTTPAVASGSAPDRSTEALAA